MDPSVVVYGQLGTIRFNRGVTVVPSTRHADIFHGTLETADNNVRQVAVKRIQTQNATIFERQLMSEAMQSIGNHPNILHYYGTANDIDFM